MQCTRPIQGWLSKNLNESGKRSIVFSEDKALTHAPLSLPCGKCLGCRMAYARDWAIRCQHEMKSHDCNCFITLTYDEQQVPLTPSGLMTLNLDDVTKFWKRLRDHVGRLRYFQCGEYGGKTHRPHYHAIVFGWDAPDRLYYGDSKSGAPMYTSELLDRIWGFGRVTVQNADSNTASYVARYVTKKQVDALDGSDDRKPEFLTMSRRPGIGHTWATNYVEEWFHRDEVILNGVAVRPPRYYEGIIAKSRPSVLQEAKRARVARALEVEHKRVTGTEVSHNSVERVREARLYTLTARDGVD